jgi:ATP-dependent Lon protease
MQEKWWRRMAADESKGWRARLLAGPEQVQALDDLRLLLPNASQLLDLAGDALAASLNSGGAARLPPVLLLGPPGVGKSYAADAIAKALGAPIVSISMPTATGVNVFGGTDAMWRNPRIGFVAEALISHASASPILFVDEVDKPLVVNGYERPLDPLHTLLEPQTAKAFKDELLEMAVDASEVTWIATANELGPLPPAVTDRFLVLEMQAPEPARMAVMIRRMAVDAFAAHPGWFEPTIDDAVVAHLARLHPRRLKRVLALACTAAAAAGARRLAEAHVVRAQSLIEQGLMRPTFGFRV